MIEAVLLGTGGMMPLPGRWLSSLLVRRHGELTLFDCGEGTQIAMRIAGWGYRRLGAICLSHTHADHVAGLPGLLHAVANSGRPEPLDIYGPAGTAAVVASLRIIASVLPFEVRVTELSGGDLISLPGGLRGRCAEGFHALPVLAYRADLFRSRAFLPDRAAALGVPVVLWRRLQSGEGVRWETGKAEADEVLGPARRGLSIGYVTDTRPTAEIVALVKEVDLLVCEGTYGSDDDAPRALRNTHLTFREAAMLARNADVGSLWLTHFSPSLDDPEAFAANATDVFPHTTIGNAGLTAALRFQDDALAD